MNTKDPYIPYGTCPRIETPWQTVSSFLQFKTSFKAFGIQEDTRNLSPFKKIHGLAQIYLKHKKRQEVFFSPRLFFFGGRDCLLTGWPLVTHQLVRIFFSRWMLGNYPQLIDSIGVPFFSASYVGVPEFFYTCRSNSIHVLFIIMCLVSYRLLQITVSLPWNHRFFCFQPGEETSWVFSQYACSGGKDVERRTGQRDQTQWLQNEASPRRDLGHAEKEGGITWVYPPYQKNMHQQKFQVAIREGFSWALLRDL